MANFESDLKKRKLDQWEDETQFSSPKKIKAAKYNYEEGNIVFSALPHEIVHFILSFITNDTQRRHIRSVCQQWFNCINYNEFNIGLLLTSEVDEFSRCFGRYQKPIGLKFMNAYCLNNLKNMRSGNKTLISSNQMFQSMLSSLTQLTALDIQLRDFDVPQELINLQSLTVTSPLDIDSLLRLTNLRRLKTGSLLAEKPTTLESLDFWGDGYELHNNQIYTAIDSTYSRLTELVIATAATRCEIPDELTNLRKLSVFEPQYIDGELINLMKVPNLEEFITSSGKLPTRYPSTLTKLHVSNCSVEINEDLTQLKDLECPRANFNNLPMNFIEGCVVHYDNAMLLELLDSQKLTKLKTRLTPENCHVWSKFTNLIDLDIELDKAPVDTSPYLVPLPSLTQMKLYYNIYPQQWMTQVPNLVYLKLQTDSKEESVNFEAMTNLTSLELIGQYKNISIIDLTNLLHLGIENTKAQNVISIHGLSTATNLTNLSVKNLSFHGSAAELANLSLLTNLRMLSLDRTYGDIINIADLTTLQHLTYFEVRVVPESVWHLTRLTRLQIISITNSLVGDRNGILQGLPLCIHFEAF